MNVYPLQTLDRVISPQRLMGEGGHQAIVDAINLRCGATTGMVFSDTHRNHLQLVQATIDRNLAVATQTVQFIKATSAAVEYIPIGNLQALQCIPMHMYVPILTHPVIRKHLAAGTIYGFGIDANMLPEEDTWGRLIQNTRPVEIIPLSVDPKPQYVTRTWTSEDPIHTIDGLEAVDTSREYIAHFIEEQLGLEADNIDPTNYPSKMNIPN